MSLRTGRLVQWNVQVLYGLLQQIVASRSPTKRKTLQPSQDLFPGKNPLDEVKEIVTLPEFCSRTAIIRREDVAIEMDGQVRQQLDAYVSSIADKYRNNPFHNFDHVSQPLLPLKLTSDTLFSLTNRRHML